MDDMSQNDIISRECRVCKCEAQPDRPLFHPCICTGSIKWIHQDCLTQWMRYSRKEYCELCGHRFTFQPIYSPNMPSVLPLRDVIGGLLTSVGTAAKYWIHYTIVAFAWLGVVPLSAYRTYRFMFSGSFEILSLPVDVFSTENIASDVFRGCFVVTCTLLSFIGIVWLREQILHGGGPDWLNEPQNIQQDLGDPRMAILGDLRPENDIGNDGVNEGHIGLADEANDNNNNENNNNEVDVNDPPPDLPIDNAEPPPPIPAAEAPDAAAGDGAGDLGNGNEEGNWNPMEWDRAAEELTWERLLGLDGSMVFLEHVFWVISLNTIFIFTFAFCPHCIGNFVINSLGLQRQDKPLMHFHGFLTTLFGYCNIGVTLVILHSIARLFKMRKIRWLFGLCYIVVKVSLLSVVEVGVLPLVCGWWLDICSLPLFDATIKDRKASFRAAPGTSLFIHWMFGMVYVYYFAAFVSLLREVLRPGVLWFFRNLNDPDFSPIQEMINFSVLRHTRRLIASAVIFGTAVLLMLWLPIQILKSFWPTFLPYVLSGDAEVNELSLQILLLQIILPGFFEQSHTRIWLKSLVRIWCKSVAWLLGLKSYLGTEANNDDEGNERQPFDVNNQGGLGAAHQAYLQRGVPVAFQPYDRPTFFAMRLFGLIVLMCISLVITSLITLTIPIWIGRQAMAFWSVSISNHNSATSTVEGRGGEIPLRPHELYTAAMGTYLCWIFSRGVAIATNLLPQGRTAIMEKFRHWLQTATSYALAAILFVLMLGVIPLLFGLLLELVLVIPLRVPLEQTPIHFLWQDWALGVLYTKIACALTMMGPDWVFKRAIERAYRDGLRDIDLGFIIRELAAPVITCFGLALSVPYVIAHSVMPMFFTNQQTRSIIAREIYPFFLIVFIAVAIIYFQIRQFKKLYIAIKNDKYLVGQRLVNYEHKKKKADTPPPASPKTESRPQQARQDDRDNDLFNFDPEVLPRI
ncbi:E3 ubiquitin-protein ligase MARCHF6 [Condylostylus longicornis]|uniref:E3 ubiquitin-protein ligase MARCHF6 n=1 Tax=Condylostylus longicornis TaxID=2530218 RepID=UPI00244E31CB|nr:E3 ubiquitin-protein ligase MARCHF6 [Condylostylus longicornis]